MPEKIVWTAAARSGLRAIDQPTALRILHALARMLAAGEGDIKRLSGIEPPEFRLRVGEYRVRFRKFENTVEIISVKHRRDAYR
jgi:mRNA interferase RelE/StbE